MAANLAQLPDLCLFAILKHLPFGDLVRIGLVCHNLNRVQQIVLPGVVKRITSIRIDDLKTNKWDSMRYRWKGNTDLVEINNYHQLAVKFAGTTLVPQLVESNYDFIVNKDSFTGLSTYFSNIKRLTLIGNCDNRDMITTALSVLSNLTELTLFVRYFKIIELKLLFDSMDNLKSLKSLAINLPIYKLFSTDSKIFNQLDHFSFKLTKCNASWSEERMSMYLYHVTSFADKYPNIESFSLWNEFDVQDANICNWPSRLTNRITRLSALKFRLSDQFKTQFQIICSKFSSLTYLDIRMSKHLSLVDALTCMATLKRLLVLKIAIFHLKQIENVNPLPLLESVKQVQFDCYLNPHKLYLLDAVFPNADQMSFKICRYRDWDKFTTKLCEDNKCSNCDHIREYILCDLNLLKDAKLSQRYEELLFCFKSGLIVKSFC